ncbi:MAG: macro domain-containing protein [Oscillospiraceae bacterium]|nr:macro domain-containing protein [Oscillospiraceae bacterium]
MALTIVRNDITKMHVDAIVNTTNEYFEVGGVGVDAGIHYAAGPGLKKALAEIGYCPVGSAVITDSFHITSCRYIIHTVGPVYWDGSNGEAEKLRSCYRSILSLARGKGCRSLAIPSISTGAYRYPKAEAYSIATSCIREFLLSLPDDEDMMVYLVLFDRDSVAVSEKVDSEVEQYIDEEYTYKKKADLHSHYKGNRSERRRGHNRPYDRDDILPSVRPYGKPVFMEEAVPDVSPAIPSDSIPVMSAPVPVAAPEAHSPDDRYRDVDLSFAEMCEWWCSEKGITKKEFYIQANINKAMFWNMKNNPRQIPKKTNALACVIGLRLDYDQAIDLLGRAGMTLSKYYETDRVVEDRIRKQMYDIDEINLELFDRDLALLGSYA